MTPNSSSPPALPTSRSGIRTPDSAPSPSRARQRLRRSRRTSRCSGATSRAAVPAERACTSRGSSVLVSRRSAAAQSPRRLPLSRVADVDSPIQNAGGKCPSDRLRGSVLTPHASLMQDVPCLPLACLFSAFRGRLGSQSCWTERIARAMRESSLSGPCASPPVTSAMRAHCAISRPHFVRNARLPPKLDHPTGPRGLPNSRSRVPHHLSRELVAESLPGIRPTA